MTVAAISSFDDFVTEKLVCKMLLQWSLIFTKIWPLWEGIMYAMVALNRSLLSWQLRGWSRSICVSASVSYMPFVVC